MSIREVTRLADAIRFRIQHPSFGAWFLAYYRNFLHPSVNPPFVTIGVSRAVLSSPVFDSIMLAPEAAQLSELGRQRLQDSRLQTADVLYLARQQRQFQRLVDYWAWEFQHASGTGETAYQFLRRPEYRKFSYVIWRSPGPYQIELNIPPVMRNSRYFRALR